MLKLEFRKIRISRLEIRSFLSLEKFLRLGLKWPTACQIDASCSEKSFRLQNSPFLYNVFIKLFIWTKNTELLKVWRFWLDLFYQRVSMASSLCATSSLQQTGKLNGNQRMKTNAFGHISVSSHDFFIHKTIIVIHFHIEPFESPVRIVGKCSALYRVP